MFYGGICLALNILAALKTTSHCLIFREGEDRLEVRRRKLQTVDHAQVVWACGIFTLKELIFCRCIQTSHSGNRTKSWEKGEVSAVVPSGLGAHFVHWCPHRELMSSFGKHCLLLRPM